MSNNESALGCGALVIIALIWSMASQCGGSDDKSDAASTAKPSATASVESPSVSPTPEHTRPSVSPTPEHTRPSVSPTPNRTSPPASLTPERPKKVTMTLAEIADTPGTFEQFRKFVAKHGTARQKKAVKHLKGWRGYERKLFRPALEVSSDYPTIDYEAIDDGDVVELDKMMDLEKQSQYIAEAFAAWWEIDETATLQVLDRGGEYAAGTACIRPDSAEKEGSCL
ncbi:hypothetical protein [Streptomyces cyslabdanicus]|uniref:hypothetical protein n=1 Tax=Streptomyces cyslabdanicus TaxID=1470456 RepID=UPI004043D0CE